MANRTPAGTRPRRAIALVGAVLAVTASVLFTELPGYTDPSPPPGPRDALLTPVPQLSLATPGPATPGTPTPGPVTPGPVTPSPEPCQSGGAEQPEPSPSPGGEAACPPVDPSPEPSTSPTPTPTPSTPAPTPSTSAPPTSPADPFPQTPFDPITSAAAAEVQALFDTMKQLQVVQTAVMTLEARFANQQAESTATVMELAEAQAERDRIEATIEDLARRLYADRAARSPLNPGSPLSRSTLLVSMGVVDPREQQLAEYELVMERLDRLTPRVDEARAALAETASALAGQRAKLAQQQAVAAGLRQRVDQNAAAPVAAIPAGPATPYTGGQLLMPVQGRLSSSFGNRYDPYYRVWQLHAGADLAAPAGAVIRAAATGRVLRAGWNGGYGNYTCLEHGIVREQRLTTCYAHQSQILVTPGQVVPGGTPIGRVGSTGASTGPHLHFEVRLGGRPMDPLPWL